MASLQGQVVVVTGAGSGVGAALVRMLHAAGAKVALAGRNAAKLDKVIAELGAGDSLLAVPTDVTRSEQCAALIATTVAKFGKVDVLVNNAGGNIKGRTLRELTPETWDAMIRANLDGAFYCLHAVMPGMLERRSGLVVNIVSVAGKRANPLGGAAYVAAKFGMGGLGLVLGNEEKDSGIRVSNIYPGEIDTPILEQRPTTVTKAHRASILKPDDVADAVMYVIGLPASVSIPELVIKPTTQGYF